MRRFSIRILGIVLCLLLVGCGQKEGQTEDAVEQFFEATVLEISEYYLLVEPVEGSSERNSADQIEVSTSRITDEKSLEYLTDAKVDDKVKIGYTNGIAESYPAQINDVLEITLVERPEEVAWAKIPMVMVNDKLYYDTGKNSTIEGRCGNMLELVRYQAEELPMAAGAEEVIYSASEMLTMENKNKKRLGSMADMPVYSIPYPQIKKIAALKNHIWGL